MSYEHALRTALDAALEAGEHLRRELHRWGGPKGHSMHADADEEAEWLIRKRLTTAFPAYWYRGEETGSVKGTEPYVWLVDPNDGTTAYLRGGRGSSVSIGLLKQGVPVLGVVYAFAAPDDRGDLIYWAEGFELSRNGKPVRRKWNTAHRNEIVVLSSLHRDQLTSAIVETVRPFRYRAVTSIAYRLALAAAGDAEAAMSWHWPGDWDYGAGHALIRGAGGIFVNEHGREITYAEDGASKVDRCFAGEPGVVRDLVQRDWDRLRKVHSAGNAAKEYFQLARPKPGHAVCSPDLLSRAQGCLLGQVAGDALGQQVEFQTPEEIRRAYPEGVRTMQDGGAWNTLAGQPTDDSELALMLARSILQQQRYSPEAAARAYHHWFDQTDPFDVGGTIGKAVKGVTPEDVKEGRVAQAMMRAANPDSQANGSLMRISPLGIYGHRKHTHQLWSMALQESALTHPHPVCQQACALFVTAIAHAIRTGATPREVFDFAMRQAEINHVDSSLIEVLKNAEFPVRDAMKQQGWVLIAFHNAFHQLLRAKSFEDGLVDTVMLGGDTDTNGAIAGALLGAVHGRAAVPFQWMQMVLSCRPDSVIHPAHPRPQFLWPIDVTIVAENLLLVG